MSVTFLFCCLKELSVIPDATRLPFHIGVEGSRFPRFGKRVANSGGICDIVKQQSNFDFGCQQDYMIRYGTVYVDKCTNW